MFDKIYIEISNICNLKCSFCPEVIRDQKIMSVEAFKNTALQAKPMTKQVCLHLMGEPLGHPQFQEIMKVCDDLGLRIFLTTNGTLIKRHSEVLQNWISLDQINFSVHSFFANSERQTLDQYLEPIFKFCEEALLRKKPYYINLRLWNLLETQENLILGNHNKNIQNNLEVLKRIEKRFNINLTTDVDVKRSKSKKIKDKLYLHFDTEFEWPTLKRDVLSDKGSCYGLRRQLAIHANGDIVPCCLDKEAVLKIGQVSVVGEGDSLALAIQSPKALEIKRGFEQGRLTQELCQKCGYAERFRG